MTGQPSLLPVKVRTLVPSPFVSADMKELAIGDDSQDYGMKRPLAHYPEHAATEALCYRLAGACGLALPVAAKLVLKDGTEAFGSRFEGGVTQYSKLTLQERTDVITACGPWLSALCALDIFLANDDRHFDNGLFRKSAIDNRWTFIAMDFSRALWFGNFPARPCGDILAAGNTCGTIAILKLYNAWDVRKAGTAVASLLSIQDATVLSWINELPAAWRTPRVDELAAWWASPARPDRVNALLRLL